MVARLVRKDKQSDPTAYFQILANSVCQDQKVQLHKLTVILSLLNDIVTNTVQQ